MMRFFATVPFSLEKPVKCELERFAVENITVGLGKVYFDCDVDTLGKILVNIRCADRIFMLVKEFEAKTFDQLFDNIARIKWQNFVSKNGKLNVSAKCARSSLMSPSDVQRIVKKAIVRSFNTDVLRENGEVYPIDIHINKDIVCVAIDCCGEGLHKRGYRIKNVEAPLRETFASCLINIAGYRRAKTLVDPFCGSGTIPIEAAMYALNIAPGMNRTFLCEKFINFHNFDSARANAKNSIVDKDITIFASDISPEMTDVTRYHAKRAGVEDFIKVSCCSAGEVIKPAESGMIITNPPYGERLGNGETMKELCSEMRRMIDNFDSWQKYILSGYKSIEREIGIKAQKTRRVYNGNIECNFILF